MIHLLEEILWLKALIEPRTLKGFRDFLPSVMIQKEAMINTIKEVFKLYGFVPIDTPTLEYTENTHRKRWRCNR